MAKYSRRRSKQKVENEWREGGRKRERGGGQERGGVEEGWIGGNEGSKGTETRGLDERMSTRGI